MVKIASWVVRDLSGDPAIKDDCSTIVLARGELGGDFFQEPNAALRALSKASAVTARVPQIRPPARCERAHSAPPRFSPPSPFVALTLRAPSANFRRAWRQAPFRSSMA